MNLILRLLFTSAIIAGIPALGFSVEPAKGDTKRLDLGAGVALEVVFIPPGEFMMGSTAEERAWAIGPEGGSGREAGGDGREDYEGVPRRTRIKDGFWMGRTKVTVGQWRRFVEETGYVTDGEKGAEMAWFDWETKKWQMAKGKGWRDPGYGFPVQDNHPVACVSWNDCRTFCQWLTKKERTTGRLPDGLEYRLPTEAEWEYACRGGRTSTRFWWGNDFKDGEGRLNIASDDPLPGSKEVLPSQRAPWCDGFVMVSPVDHYGEKGRNEFGLADMIGNVWEICLDHWDPKGAHEDVCLDDVPQRVCRAVSFMARPGFARCAVRLGLRGPDYSDSRDGFRICLGPRIEVK
ncbi:MAG: SUMF1/EgtB/PvdO family nonheme iron enzyme [Verrucomicrobiaceae bacterium]